eukprot:11503499-Karenia_brevis.AAC.1
MSDISNEYFSLCDSTDYGSRPTAGPSLELFYVLHLYSGQRRPGDFQWFFERLAGPLGLPV